MDIIQGAVTQGFLWSILALGVYITYRILNIPDMTAEGSFPMGGAVAVKCMLSGWDPFTATLFAFLAGMIAGLVTGILHTKLKIPSLISGILCMTGLYSINLRIMGQSNIPFLRMDTVITWMVSLGFTRETGTLLLGAVCSFAVVLLLWLFFCTERGFVIRATGNNPVMIRALGVNTDNMIIAGLAISNGLIAMAGSLIGQEQGYVDIGMGIGTIVIGLASLIIGEVLFGKTSILRNLLAVVLGAVLYRLIISLALQLRMRPGDLKLLYSILLVVALVFPLIKKRLLNALSPLKKGVNELKGE